MKKKLAALVAAVCLLALSLQAPAHSVGPVVNAGPDFTVAINTPRFIDATITPDAKPISQITWQRVGWIGPAPDHMTWNPTNQATTDTTVNFTVAGTYTLRLSAMDTDGNFSSDDVIVTVTGGTMSPKEQALRAVPGLTHYYPLNSTYLAQDRVGTQHGTVTGATFDSDSANFDGNDSISLGDHNDFSVKPNNGLTIVVDVEIDNWNGVTANNEYLHWMGKGTGSGATGQQEWAMRHYKDCAVSCSGEAPVRQGRTSFYVFPKEGGVAPGSYFQNGEPTDRHTFVGTVSLTTITWYRDGVQVDQDSLGSTFLTNGTAPAKLGTRGDNTGFLIGQLANVAFYNRVLTATEVDSIS